MKLKVKTTITLEVDVSDTINDVKAKVQERIGIPPDQQKIFNYDGKRMWERRSLSDYNIQEGAHIFLEDGRPKIMDPGPFGGPFGDPFWDHFGFHFGIHFGAYLDA